MNFRKLEEWGPRLSECEQVIEDALTAILSLIETLESFPIIKEKYFVNALQARQTYV